MTRTTRALAAGFDAVVMVFAAYAETGGRFALVSADLVLWGSAIAAALCAYLAWSDHWPEVAWIAIGYVLFGALLTRGSPHWILLGLAVALMPLVPRPRGSVALGLGVAAVAAVGVRYAIAAVL